MKSIDESDVGIFCYISQLPGFRGILKQRYSDFIVNEVDLEGTVVHLTSLEAPAELVEEKEVLVADQPNKNYDAEIGSFRALAGDFNADMLKALLDQTVSGGGVEIEPIVLSPSSDKSHRTAVHNFFKEKLKFLVTDTIDGPDATSKCIRVRLNGGKSHGRHSFKKRKDRDDKPYDGRGSDNWPEHLGKYLRFHLYKENKDTQEALGLIGKMLGIQPRSFGFAGTKDKRSISTQRVTVFKQRANRLAALNERLIGIKVGDFCHVNDGLLLGQLHGNRFTVTLRGVVAESEAVIEASANALGKLGFINYFGLQRFGSGSVPTHLIGATLLRGEWKNAVDMILDPREGEKEAVGKVREYYKDTGDIEGTLRQLPRHLVAERAILQRLKRSPGNYLQALKSIPRTLRMMYIHSYQSYLWNHAASMRVQKYGIDHVVLGDLVYCKEHCREAERGANYSEFEDGSSNDTSNHIDEISEADLPEEKDVTVKVITEEDLSAGTYTVDDVVLPLPGSKVIYPMNDIEEVYCDLAKKDAIGLTESVHAVKEFSITNITGAYRRVFLKPKEFEWELLTYKDGNIPLAETDMDLISKSQKLKNVRGEDCGNGKAGEQLIDNGRQSCVSAIMDSAEDEAGSDRAGSHQTEVYDSADIEESQKALRLSFTLPASGYATMAIRELLKTSTSVAFHKTLNP
ncbi:multisubstrate pseudouridine synthase 7 [Coffea eugenioides]|uniref:multisubstrate pseudouridine synthase 7 n=1 Tax=Coffea eugenioides TaxID=49369 RepID=UPI000F6052F6|nr:multisubstrate pseudouridine synthase 7 [Coffea eugenioides]